MIDVRNLKPGQLLFFKKNNDRLMICNKAFDFNNEESMALFLGYRRYPKKSKNFIGTMWVLDVLLGNGKKAAIPLSTHILKKDYAVLFNSYVENENGL